MMCGLSEIECKECEQNPSCQIYSERYVLTKQAKKLLKVLRETETIAKAIVKKNGGSIPTYEMVS